MPQIIRLHFDGGFLIDGNRITARTLAKTMTHMQAAIDRAYLDSKSGSIQKYERIGKDFPCADFVVGDPEAGSLIFSLRSNSNTKKGIIDRLVQAISPAYELSKKYGIEKAETLAREAQNMSQLHSINKTKHTDYNAFQEKYSQNNCYGDRSIIKEIDQILSMNRSSHIVDPKLDIELQDKETHNFSFNRKISTAFHTVASRRTLGDLVLYQGRIRALDERNRNGKFVNSDSGGVNIIHFASREQCISVKNLLGIDGIKILGAPIFEYGTHDPVAGDFFFIEEVK